MVRSEAILKAVKDVKFIKETKESNVKEFLKNFGETGKNGNRPVVRKQRGVITFEDRKYFYCLEQCGEETMGE